MAALILAGIAAAVTTSAHGEDKSVSAGDSSLDMYGRLVAVHYWPVTRDDYTGYEGTQKFSADRNGADSAPGGETENGIIDWGEFSVIEKILGTPACSLHEKVREAWTVNLGKAKKDVVPLGRFTDSGFVPGSLDDWAYLVAGYMTLGDSDSSSYVANVLAEFSIVIDASTYNTSLESILSASGDADGDGVSNKEEYAKALGGKGRKEIKDKEEVAAYVDAALDGLTKSSPAQ